MCDITKIELFSDVWDDYFAFINSDIYSKLKFEDELYIAYGSYNNLPVEDIREWYKDAEEFYVGSFAGPAPYIESKYQLHVRSDEDIQHFIDQDIKDGSLYECGGYWFRD